MINTITLDNGIRIVSEKMDHLQTVAFGVFFKAGSIDESPELYGASHFIEHMMFKGTKNISAEKLNDTAKYNKITNALAAVPDSKFSIIVI